MRISAVSPNALGPCGGFLLSASRSPPFCPVVATPQRRKLRALLVRQPFDVQHLGEREVRDVGIPERVAPVRLIELVEEVAVYLFQHLVDERDENLNAVLVLDVLVVVVVARRYPCIRILLAARLG